MSSKEIREIQLNFYNEKLKAKMWELEALYNKLEALKRDIELTDTAMRYYQDKLIEIEKKD
jgi:hypothetical protein